MDELAAYAADNGVALSHYGDPLTPTQVIKALAIHKGFTWGAEAAFGAMACNALVAGDADVINTDLQLILPCLDEIKVLVSITDERISVVPDAPAIGEISEDLNTAHWNGISFIKDTQQDVRNKVIAVAGKTVMSDRA